MVRIAATAKLNSQSLQTVEQEGCNERAVASGLIARSTGLLSGMCWPGISDPALLSGDREGGAGSTHGGQAELTLSCKLELLSGRPLDWPGCAVSADP